MKKKYYIVVLILSIFNVTNAQNNEFIAKSLNNESDLDSTVYFHYTEDLVDSVRSYKYSYSYDAKKRVIEKFNYGWYSDFDSWKLSTKVEYVYGENDSLNSESYFTFDFDSNSLVEQRRTENYYNSDNYLLRISQYTLSNNSLVERSRIENYYNTENYLLETHNYNNGVSYISSKIVYTYEDSKVKSITNYNHSAGILIEYSKVEYEYVSSGYIKISYSWDDNAWVKGLKYIVVINDNNDVTSRITFSWDDYFQGWKKVNKELIYYLDNNLFSNSEQYVWTEFGTWKKNYWKKYTYDSSFNILGYESAMLHDSHMDETEIWIGEMKYDKTYDSNNNVTSYIEYMSDEWGELNWFEFGKIEYIFDSNNNLKVSLFYYKDYHHGDYNTVEKQYYYYQDNALSDEQLIVESFIFPNPVSDILNIKVNEVSSFDYQIFDNIGRVIISGKSKKNDIEVNVSSLTKGLYILKVSSSGKYFTKELIK